MLKPKGLVLAGGAMNMKKFRVPNEDIQLTDDEIAITQTKTFQRLFNLKQLGLAYLVYPAASHTRGHHSIRCLQEAHKILEAVNEDKAEHKRIRIAALLHDIGHVPFSHTLEDEHLVLEKHDGSTRLTQALEALKKELKSEQVRLIEEATPILTAISSKDEKDHDWKSDVVGNTVCADLLAYITTDAEWTGIEKRPGHYRIYEYFETAPIKIKEQAIENEKIVEKEIEKNRLCIRLTKGGLRTDIVSAIMDLLDMRYALTERVIFHHAKCVASAMLARAARLCGLSNDPTLLEIGDEGFFQYLETLAVKGQADGATRLLERLRARRLYKRIFKIVRGSRDEWDESKHQGAFCEKWRNGKVVEELLDAVEKEHKLPKGSLVLWCPEGKSGMKLVKAQVVWDSTQNLQGPYALRSDEVKNQFPGIGKRVNVIEEQYLDLWTFWIALDREHIDCAHAVVRSLERELGVKCNPVFVETHLSKLPGYKDMESLGRRVSSTLQSIQPVIEKAVNDQAALDGSRTPDENTILAVIKNVVDKKITEGEHRQREHKEVEGQMKIPESQEGNEDSSNSGNK